MTLCHSALSRRGMCLHRVRGITGSLNYVNSLTREQWAGVANSVSFSPSNAHLTLPTEVWVGEGAHSHARPERPRASNVVRCASDSTDAVVTSLRGAVAALEPTHLLKSVDLMRGSIRSPARSS
jgi:hypothetical protein